MGLFSTPPAVVVADDVEDEADVPAGLEHPFNDVGEAVHAALDDRASAGNVFRIVRDPHSGRWGYHEVPRSVHPAEDDTLPDDMQFPFNTVAEATTGALRHLEPYWGDAQTALLIDAGVAVSGMPSNAENHRLAGYRAGVDGGLYELDQAELQAVHERTDRGVASKPEKPQFNMTSRSASRSTRAIAREALATTPPETRELPKNERLARSDDAKGE